MEKERFLSSPKRVDGEGPVQEAQRTEAAVLEGLNRLRVSDSYSDPTVREGVMDINLIAVKDYADQIAATNARGGDWQADLDTEFAQVMHSFVGEQIKHTSLLAAAIERDGLTGEEALAAWEACDRLRTMDDKRAFVIQFEPQTEIG